jgi:glycosyltransferase involved in cell wall biosynthesis
VCISASACESVRLTIIIPCYNEKTVHAACLDSILGQRLRARGDVEIVVVLNGCTDGTREIAERYSSSARDAGFPFSILELERPSKAAALNAGDAVARGAIRAYLDADVVLGAGLLARLVAPLETDEPRYATGMLVVAPPRTWVTAAYGGFWSALVSGEVNGIGLYAVNAAGRARWGRFPPMHSDDKFVRLSFLPRERVRVPAGYLWPLPEGWRKLVLVRLRWTEGNLELKRRFPEMTLRQTRAKRPWIYIGAALRDPVGFLVFSSIYLACWLLARRDVETEHSTWRRAR